IAAEASRYLKVGQMFAVVGFDMAIPFLCVRRPSSVTRLGGCGLGQMGTAAGSLHGAFAADGSAPGDGVVLQPPARGGLGQATGGFHGTDPERGADAGVEMSSAPSALIGHERARRAAVAGRYVLPGLEQLRTRARGTARGCGPGTRLGGGAQQNLIDGVEPGV